MIFPPPDGPVIVIPDVPPTLKEFVAVNVPPPAKVILAMAAHAIDPLFADDTVAEPPDELCKTRLALKADPAQLMAFVTVSALGKIIIEFEFKFSVVIVGLAPLITTALGWLDPDANVTVAYVLPPVENVRCPVMLVPVITIVEVPALSVKFVAVPAFHGVDSDAELSVNVPDPIFNVRVPVPVRLNPVVELSVTLLLFALKSRTHPLVEAVQAPIVIEDTVTVVFTVIVQVVPPTQVAASSVTSSAELGTEAPVAPPLVADHIAVLDASQVQVVAHIANRAAASAENENAQNASSSAAILKKCFMTYLVT